MTDSSPWPKEPSEDLLWILGRPNFWCGPLAHLFQAAGYKIEKKAEAEQAFIIHWLVGLWFEHGDKWRDVAEDKIKEIGAAAVIGKPTP